MFHIGRGHFTKQIKELGFEVHNYQNESCIDETVFEEINSDTFKEILKNILKLLNLV